VRAGYEPVDVDRSELLEDGGGVTCETLEIRS
jgi:N-dimethylarginine dimethylaminohydrolase